MINSCSRRPDDNVNGGLRQLEKVGNKLSLEVTAKDGIPFF